MWTTLILDFSNVASIDFTAIQVLSEAVEDLITRKIVVAIAQAPDTVSGALASHCSFLMCDVPCGCVVLRRGGGVSACARV